MDDDGSLGFRNWTFYETPLKSNLGLQLMSSSVERDTKPLFCDGGFLHRECSVPDQSLPLEFVRDGWMHHNRDPKVHHVLPMNHNYNLFCRNPHPATHPLQMPQPVEPPTEDRILMIEEPEIAGGTTPLKKRPHVHSPKALKPKKKNKVKPPRDESSKGSTPRIKNARKNMELVINGIDLDISEIPTPVCSCTGTPHQCYRWGVGGWQSACCTNSISMFPLPMSVKRRGTRIAGRKMSQGAFKKVLERLAGEGSNLSNPIDLMVYWAKHGTNKFVTIR